MDLKINERVIAGIIILICIIFVAMQIPGMLKAENPDVCYVNGVCQHEKQLLALEESIPVFVAIGIVIGALVFWFMSGKLQKQKDLLKTNTQIILQFLDEDERLVVQKIIENKGKILQAEITRIPEIGKVKSHRILQRLQDKKIVKIEGFGKTNMVVFSEEIKSGLL